MEIATLEQKLAFIVFSAETLNVQKSGNLKSTNIFHIIIKFMCSCETVNFQQVNYSCRANANC